MHDINAQLAGGRELFLRAHFDSRVVPGPVGQSGEGNPGAIPDETEARVTLRQ